MRMDEIGYHHKHDKSFIIDRPNGAGDWLLLIIKTPAIFRIGNKNIHAKSNSFIIYTPDYPEYYMADGEEYIDDWIHFGADEEEQTLMHALKIPLNQVIHIGEISAASAIVRNMCYEYYSAHSHRMEITNLYFRVLLYKLHEKLEINVPESVLFPSIYVDQLLWIRECIYRYPSQNWCVDIFAKDLSLSRSRFQHLYADTFGTSVSQDIIHSRIQHASDLIMQSNQSIDEIAHACGYNSTSYFVRQFKNTTGKTPSQFRESIKK